MQTSKYIFKYHTALLRTFNIDNFKNYTLLKMIHY